MRVPGAGLFVLVGGYPASGKSTLARALAAELELPLLVKDEVKEAMIDVLGRPSSVAESQRIGRAAVRVLLRVAMRSPSAVLDSTWFAYIEPLDAGDMYQKIRDKMWTPVYRPYRRSS